MKSTVHLPIDCLLTCVNSIHGNCSSSNQLVQRELELRREEGYPSISVNTVTTCSLRSSTLFCSATVVVCVY